MDKSTTPEDLCSDILDIILSNIFNNKNDSNYPSGLSSVSNDHHVTMFALRCALLNVRGFHSKEASVINILVDEGVEILILVETQCTQGEFPKVPGYFTFFRNRENRKGGGIAILVAEKYKGHARLLETGAGKCEYITVVMSCFAVPVHITAYYGQQENTSGHDEITEHLGTVMGSVQAASAAGAQVVWAGDFNNKTGEQLTANPVTTISRGGKVLLDMLKETDLHCMNSHDINFTEFTHVDRSSNTSNVLDYVFTNTPDLIEKVEIDGGFTKSPHYTRLRNGTMETAYTDHCAIFWNILVEPAESINKPRKKITKWLYGAPGGAEGFKRCLEDQAGRLGEVVLDKSTSEAVSEIIKTMDKAKHKWYKKSTCTAAKLEKIEESKLWSQRADELQNFLDQAADQPGKEMHRIFFARKQVMARDRYEQPSAVKNLETGEILTKKEEINKYTLKYNEDLLKKQPPPGEWAVERNQMECDLEEMIKLENDFSKEPIRENEFEEAVFEIIDGKKDCYLDFLRSGPQFKMVIFALIQKIYLTGEVPREFQKTNLMKLYKKGDRKLLSNYRFLHLKHWLCKITEKVIMKRLKTKMSEATPHNQLGGRKNASCVEHLVELATVLNIRSKQKKPTVVTFMDVVKCFDQVPLAVVCYEAAKAGIVGNPLKALRDINSDTVMSIVGDDSGDTFTARDTVGQGMVSACEGSALAMSRAVQRATQDRKFNMKVGETKVDMMEFVDDVAGPDENADAARETGERLTSALDQLGLKAHPSKSVHIICGPAAAKRKIQRQLSDCPQKIQEAVIQEVPAEKYLGLEFTNKSPRQNITRNIEIKKAKVIVKVKIIKKLLNHPAIRRLGWMRAAIGFIQSIVVQTQMYGVESFINMSKKQVKDMEKIQKDAIYDILGLSVFTNYNAVLCEIGVLRAEDTIKLRKASFVNKLLYTRDVCECRDILREEENIGHQGLLAEVRQYSAEWKLPDLTSTQVLKKTLDFEAKKHSMNAMWRSLLSSKKVIMRWSPEKTSNRSYFMFNKFESQLMLALMVGELNFLTNRSKEYLRSLGSTECLVRVCGGEDTLDHVSQCFGYNTRYTGDGSEKSQAEFLVELHKERVKKFKFPLIHVRN